MRSVLRLVVSFAIGANNTLSVIANQSSLLSLPLNVHNLFAAVFFMVSSILEILFFAGSINKTVRTLLF